MNPSDELRKLSSDLMNCVGRINALALHYDMVSIGGYNPSGWTIPKSGDGSGSAPARKRPDRTPNNHHKKWTEEHKTQLTDLIRDGHKRSEIAKELQRTSRAIFCKQRQLALQKQNEGCSTEEIIAYTGLTQEELEDAGKLYPRRSRGEPKTAKREVVSSHPIVEEVEPLGRFALEGAGTDPNFPEISY
jgi:hypothetical protein